MFADHSLKKFPSVADGLRVLAADPQGLKVVVLLRVSGVVATDFAQEALRSQAVGFGSHHWLAAGAAGRRLFANVDDLAAKLRTARDTTDAAFRRARYVLIASSAVRAFVLPLTQFEGMLPWKTTSSGTGNCSCSAGSGVLLGA